MPYLSLVLFLFRSEETTGSNTKLLLNAYPPEVFKKGLFLRLSFKFVLTFSSVPLFIDTSSRLFQLKFMCVVFFAGESESSISMDSDEDIPQLIMPLNNPQATGTEGGEIA